MGKKKEKKETMKILRPTFHFIGIQIKSEKVLREFAHNLSEMEMSVGIHSCTITLEDIFVCPDIDLERFIAETPTEELVLGLILEMDCGR